MTYSLLHRMKVSVIATALLVSSTPILSAQEISQGLGEASSTDSVVINPSATKLSLEINKGKLIRLSRPASAVFIANPKIADVQVKSPRVVYVFGITEGETSFYALDEDDNTIYSAEVSVDRNLSQLRDALDKLLPDNQIIASNIGGMIILQGQVESPDQAATAEELARSVTSIKTVMNKLAITQPTQVNLRVRIAEVSRDIVKQLGVRWESAFANGSGALIGLSTGAANFELIKDAGNNVVRNFLRTTDNAASIVGGYTKGNWDLNAMLDAMDDEGFITMLAEPNLTALSGSSASFIAGGEYPVPVPDQNGIAIEFKEFGVKLDFTPTVLNSGNISLQVAPEVSDISTSGAIQIVGISVPSITTRRTSTTVELGSGQSFAIAGLIQNRVIQNASKVPGLGDIPILGALFRSTKFRNNETELLIVVTPYLVRPVSDHKITLPTDGWIAPGDMDQYLKEKRWKTTPDKKKKKKEPKKGPALKKRAGFKIN